tara:strand:- start:491 stop:664 length:174 start_codon:yes stop_codon:yes gene_type:complete
LAAGYGELANEPPSKPISNVIAFLFGGAIPFFTYFSYKYVLSGFEDKAEVKLGYSRR